MMQKEKGKKNQGEREGEKNPTRNRYPIVEERERERTLNNQNRKNVKTIKHFGIFSLSSVSLACYSLISLHSLRVVLMKLRRVYVTEKSHIGEIEGNCLRDFFLLSRKEQIDV